MDKISKNELITKIVARAAEGGTKITRKDAEAMFGATFSVIASEIAAGNKVAIPQFGSFGHTVRAEHSGRNPVTKEAIIIPKKVIPTFKAAASLKDAAKAIEGEE